MTDDAVARGARTDLALQAAGLSARGQESPIDGDMVVLPVERAVLARAAALIVVATDGTTERGKLYPLIGEYDLSDHFSANERAFLAAEVQTDDDRLDFGWRYESAAVLLWALGLFDMSPLPRAQALPFDVTMALIAPDRDVRAAARMRPKAEILDAADLHLACAHALLGTAPAAEAGDLLDRGVTIERYKAFMWLLNPVDWDMAGR